jgi:hypothetical protein
VASPGAGLTDRDVSAEVKRYASAGLVIDVQRFHDGPSENAAPTPSLKTVVTGRARDGHSFRIDVSSGRVDVPQTYRQRLADAVAAVQSSLRGERATGVLVAFSESPEAFAATHFYHGSGWRSVARV